MSIYSDAAAINGAMFPAPGEYGPDVLDPENFIVTQMTTSTDANGAVSFAGTGYTYRFFLNLKGTVVSDVTKGTFAVGDQNFQILGSLQDRPDNLVFQDITGGKSDGQVYVWGTYPSGRANELNLINFSSENPYTPPARIFACFVTGTGIMTPTGMRPVEDLEVGDLIETAEGAAVPLVWKGRQTVRCGRSADAANAWPYRIRRDAFAPGIPFRDTLLSGGHMVALDCLEQVLVPVALLANGCTIAQVEIAEFDYWHIELARHDIIVADGLLAESYLDVGNRWAFDRSTNVVALAPADAAAPRPGACRPVITNGPVLAALRDRLTARAVALGWRLRDRDPELTVVADGKVLEVTGGGRAEVALPAGTAKVVLASSSFTPQHFAPGIGDRRRLGLCVHALTIIDAAGATRELIREDRCLAGFSYVEEGAGGIYRWTNGSAVIKCSAWTRHGPATLFITFASVPQPCWALDSGPPHRAAA